MPISIEQVLGCKALPSLPGVAVEVLTLTRDPNVPLERIAKTIQNDAALTARVLRTVNSSYYGLAQKCATLNRAIGYLGVKTVKSLVLGFSLVDTTKGVEGQGFDLNAYWGRGIYSATAARLIASATGATDPDEAFTACLVQDIGMLACYAAMGSEYDAILADAPLSHDSLAAFETRRLGFDHCEVGSRLAEKWNLPAQHVEVIRHHHSPDSITEHFRQLARVVALSNMVAEIARAELPGQPAARLVARTQEWFGDSAGDIEAMLQRVNDGARQLSKEFGKVLGTGFDAAAIMSEANELLLESSIQGEREAVSLKRSTEEMSRAALTDALTGAFNRKHFDAEMKRVFDEAAAARGSMGVLFIDGDRFKSVNDTHGHAAGDAVLKELAARFKAASPNEAIVCRYGGEEFAIILPGYDMERSARAADAVLRGVSSRPFPLSGTGAREAELGVTVSIGVAATAAGDGAHTLASLVRAADEAVYAAKQNGRNRVERAGAPARTSAVPGATPNREMAGDPAPRAHETQSPPTILPSPVAPAPARGTIDVLLVENDPLAGRLLITLLGRRPNTSVRLVRSAEEAIPLLNDKSLPNLVITDLKLRSMSGAQLIACARANPRTRGLPMVVLSASDDPEDEAECMRAGADFYMNKQMIVTDLTRTVTRLMSAAA